MSGLLNFSRAFRRMHSTLSPGLIGGSLILQTYAPSPIITQIRYRAKKSTRERKLKDLRKIKARKATETRKKQLEYLMKKKTEDVKDVASPRFSDSNKEVACDDVWFADMFRMREYTFVDAVNALRESHHPTMSNEPCAPLKAFVELDMSLDKATKFADKFQGTVSVKYPYKHNENRSILAFCKTREELDDAIEAGATLAGGLDIIKDIKRGKMVLADFQYVIAHPNIMADLLAIRGLLRRSFPTLENGTLDVDLVKLIQNLQKGIRYEVQKDPIYQDYGWVDVMLGTLDTNVDHLKDNFMVLLNHINLKAPKIVKERSFITRTFLKSDVTGEKFKIPFEQYLTQPGEESDSDEDEEEEVKKKGRR